MKKIITMLLVGLLVFSMSTGLLAAEKEIVIKGLYGLRGSWGPSDIEEHIYRGDESYSLILALSVALFQYKYPNIKVELMDWHFWGEKVGERLRAALAAGEAPPTYPMAYTELGGPQGMINEGLVADITDLVKDWEQAKYIPEVVWQQAWRLGKCYGIPHRMSPYRLIYYRKDWYEEAGIFNEKGKPAPPDNWTWDDFAEIAVKLTNPKANRWGISLASLPGDEWIPVSTTFGAPMLRPDDTGKYTWKAAFNLPMGVKTLQLYKDLVWKHKAALVGIARSSSDARADFMGWRAGMLIRHFQEALSYAHRPRFAPDKPIFDEVTGVAPYPKGPHEVRIQQTIPHLFGFNPTLSKEQLGAAFKWMDWSFAGDGRAIDYFWRCLVRDYNRESGPPHLLSPYHVEIGGIVTDPKTHYSAHYAIDRLAGMPPDWLPTYEKIIADPVKPYMGTYGLWEPNVTAFETALQVAIDKILTDPNADPKTELDKAADIANKTALNEKLKGVTTENMKDYCTALGEFYQKNFPKYYQEVFKGLLENYYKVW